MRSFLFTSALALITFILGFIAYRHWQGDFLTRWIGSPLPIGSNLYPDFPAEKVVQIRLKKGDLEAVFQRTPKGWFASSPWDDRVDIRAASAILGFVKSAKVLDYAERDKVNKTSSGLASGNTEIRLYDEAGNSLAHFRLGNRSPWLNISKEEKSSNVPSTYFLPLEKYRKTHVYAAAGDITILFKNDFSYLRDHRPFFMNPNSLNEIRIKTKEGELSLARESSKSSWKIVKPLELSTDANQMKKLLHGLMDLEAKKISDRTQSTLSTTDPETVISLSSFDNKTESILHLYTSDLRLNHLDEVLGRISDRPDTIFTFLKKSQTDGVSLSDLPLTVNALRDRSLTGLTAKQISSMRGIAIKSASTPTILISREQNSPWIATIGEKEQLANELRVFELLKAITDTQVESFETDAASSDLSVWGLERPILSLIVLFDQGTKVHLSFGLGNYGQLYAKRDYSSSILRINEQFLQNVGINPYEWRHGLLWSLSKVDLTRIVRQEGNELAIDLSYEDLSETWKAYQNNKEITQDLDPLRANFLLNTLESLQVQRWLLANDQEVLNAMKNPVLTFQITEKNIDEFGESKGIKQRLLKIGSSRGRFFGLLSQEESAFELSQQDLLKLSVPILDN